MLKEDQTFYKGKVKLPRRNIGFRITNLTLTFIRNKEGKISASEFEKMTLLRVR